MAGPIWILNVPQVSNVEGLVLSVRKAGSLGQGFVGELCYWAVWGPNTFGPSLPLLRHHTLLLSQPQSNGAKHPGADMAGNCEPK